MSLLHTHPPDAHCGRCEWCERQFRATAQSAQARLPRCRNRWPQSSTTAPRARRPCRDRADATRIQRSRPFFPLPSSNPSALSPVGRSSRARTSPRAQHTALDCAVFAPLRRCPRARVRVLSVVLLPARRPLLPLPSSARLSFSSSSPLPRVSVVVFRCVAVSAPATAAVDSCGTDVE